MSLVQADTGIYDGYIIPNATISSVDMFLYETGLINDRDPFSVFDLCSYIQAGPISYEGLHTNPIQASNIMVRYPSTMMIQNGHSYVNSGYLQPVGKALEYKRAIDHYREGNVVSIAQEQTRDVIDGIYDESAWFSESPLGQFYPVPIPTSVPVSMEFINKLCKLTKICSYSAGFGRRWPCPFTGKSHDEAARALLGKDMKPGTYTFISDGIIYSFSTDIFHYMVNLNIHPTKRFVEAVGFKEPHVSS
jgi:hypothetical protein